MTDLLIDLGNSRLKWAQSGTGRWLPGAALYRDRDLAMLLDDVWSELSPPQQIVMVSVAADVDTRTLEIWLRDRWQQQPRRMVAQSEQLGVVNSYRDPSTLGADRWAALLGARGLTEHACAIVDCGTAVTIDVLSGDGAFAGGVIIPGLHLLRQSLNRGTAGISKSEGDDSSCFAHTTADGVAAGTLFGLAGAIERVLREQERVLDRELEVFITGGDAALLASRLMRPAIEIPDLVLKGLARAAEESN